MIFIEVIGYIGMLLIVSSFLFKDVKKIRILNIIGAVFSVIYGILTTTGATTCLNLTLIVVNTIKLLSDKKEK